MIEEIHKDLPLGKQAAPFAECEVQKSTTMFVQYQCLISEQDLVQRKEVAQLSVWLTIFSTALLVIGVNVRKSKLADEKSLWDMQTVTAGDYTVHINLSHAQMEKLRSATFNDSFKEDEPIGFRMKVLLVREIEKSLRQVVTMQNNNPVEFEKLTVHEK